MNKRFLALTMASLLAVGGINCSAEETEAAEDDKITIGCVMMNLTNNFYVNAMEGGDAAAEDFGAECIWKGADSKLEDQVALIENFVQQGVDAIFVDPMDAEGIIPALEAANEAGVKCISFGNFVNADFAYCIVYDDYNNMYKMGEIVGKYIGEEGTVANFIGSPGNYVSDNREAGFADGITENYPDINLLPSQPANWDASLGYQQMAALLAANDVDAAFCMNDAVTYGLLEAIEASGQDTLMFSNDGDIEASELVKEGKIKVDVLTGAKRAGYYGIKTITQIVRGEVTEQKNYLPSHFIMGDEMREFCEENNLVDDVSVLSPDEAIAAYDNYREEFGPDAAG
ncbi:MAG TPA: sugar ABC transporter substrate-binding protein [Candidatus Choladousia intestinigallinarum]|nr:sugar ABC transporter substrate-binding protein [Candidatus Choladousia intestinigallinarum]